VDLNMNIPGGSSMARGVQEPGSRKDFEKYVRDNAGGPVGFWVEDDGKYTVEAIQSHWETWQQAQSAFTQAALEVLAERARQISVEGWTPEHDDGHGDGSLSLAAACYAMFDVFTPSGRRQTPRFTFSDIKQFWPWEIESWKPKDRRRNLVRAAALILAQIERDDRADSNG
jgi:hypothetical protein